jgi:hypothetical protein
VTFGRRTFSLIMYVIKKTYSLSCDVICYKTFVIFVRKILNVTLFIIIMSLS